VIHPALGPPAPHRPIDPGTTDASHASSLASFAQAWASMWRESRRTCPLVLKAIVASFSTRRPARHALQEKRWSVHAIDRHFASRQHPPGADRHTAQRSAPARCHRSRQRSSGCSDTPTSAPSPIRRSGLPTARRHARLSPGPPRHRESSSSSTSIARHDRMNNQGRVTTFLQPPPSLQPRLPQPPFFNRLVYFTQLAFEAQGPLKTRPAGSCQRQVRRPRQRPGRR
jgi:hypothetical protein